MATHARDFIPQSEGDFWDFQFEVVSKIEILGPSRGIIITGGGDPGKRDAKEERLASGLDDPTFVELKVQQQKYLTARAVAHDPSTSTVVTRNKFNTEFHLFMDMLRVFIRVNITNNPLFTDDDRRSMRLPVRSDSRTPSQAESTHPVGDGSSTTEPATLEFRVHDEGSSHARILLGQMGVEIAYVVSDVDVTDWVDLVHSEISTKAIFRITFDSKYRGKYVYFAFRWIGPRGQKGQWSNIQKIIIP